MRVALIWGVIFLVSLSGCGRGGSASPQGCADPVRGTRYALCGKLVSSAGTAADAHGYRVIGAFQSMPARVSTHYSIEGGTFRAQR